MNHANTQLVTESDPIMQTRSGGLKESVTHVLLCSSPQGVDVVPVAKNYDHEMMEVLAGNLWQSSLQSEAVTNLHYVPILSAEDSLYLPEVQIRRGHTIPGTYYSSFSSGQGQTTQGIHAYIEGTWGIIDTAVPRNLIEGIFTGYLLGNVSATSLVDNLRRPALTNAASDSPRSLISALQEGFEFRSRDAVIRFLWQNPFLIALLLESHEKIRAEFGDPVQLILQVVRDPESDQDDELFLTIKTTLSPQQASESLERLDKNWWVDASSAAQCKLNIDYELA